MQIAIIFMTIFQPLSTQQHIILNSQMPVAFNQSIVGPLLVIALTFIHVIFKGPRI